MSSIKFISYWHVNDVNCQGRNDFQVLYQADKDPNIKIKNENSNLKYLLNNLKIV